MLSSVLRSRQAIQVNVEIMRAFVRLRKIIATNEDLSRRLNELEKRHEGKFKVVFEVIRSLMSEAGGLLPVRGSFDLDKMAL